MKALTKNVGHALRLHASGILARLVKQQTRLLTRIVLSDQYQNGPSVDLSAFQQAYQVHPWVFACVKVIANNVGRVRFQAYERRVINGKLIKIPLPDHPISRVLRRPNPHLSAFDLIMNTAGYKELSGNSFWLIARNRAGVAEQIIPLRPDRVTIVPDKGNMVLGYIYRLNDFTASLRLEDVIHHKFFNPFDDLYGQSTLQAAKMTLMDDTEARRFNFMFYKNSGRPDGALVFDHTLSESDYSRIRKEWRLGHSGSENAHRIAILEKGSEYKQVGISQKDMDFVEGRKLNREEIASVFSVPPVLINSYEHANYNTAKTQVALFWHETLIPKLVQMRETLTNSIYNLMGPAAAPLVEDQELFVDFDLSDVWALTHEKRQAMLEATEAVQSGLITINEVREQNNRAPVVWGDTWWKSRSQVDVLDPPEEDILPIDDQLEEEEEDEEQAPQEEATAITRDSIRDITWKRFVDQTEDQEEEFAKFVEVIMLRQEKEMLRNLRKVAPEFVELNDRRITSDEKIPESIIDQILFSLEDNIDFVRIQSSPLIKELLRQGMIIGAGLASALPGQVEQDTPSALLLLEKRKQRFAKRINETTWTSVKTSLIEGLKNGEGIKALANRIEETMGARQAKKFEIARTEVIGATNGGIDESYKQLGVEQKEWLSARDEAVRESHAEADGQRVAINAAFHLTGGTLRYPGDPDGPPEEVINCRCTSLPVQGG